MRPLAGVMAPVIGAMVVLAGCNREAPKLDKAPTPVRVETVAMYTPSGGERYSASMLPDRQVTLSFRIGGFVESVYQLGNGRNVDIGDVIPQGTVLARKNTGMGETITVRKISFGHGVERIFPLSAKIIDHIDIVRTGRVRRAKLYYLRKLKGKAARLKERA